MATIASARIEGLRRELGLTQAQLAEQLGVSLVTLNRWERGHAQPSTSALRRLDALETAIRHGGAPPAVDQPTTAAARPEFLAPPVHVKLVTEAERLSFGYLASPAFATETSLIDPLPHQRLAVYEHMLPQPRLRFLLADDAGAGKTIMAGLYIREMLARRLIRRILIVPPAGLLGNWQRELSRLFGLRFAIMRGADARAGNPFVGPDSDRIICSVDTLAADSMFSRLQDPAVLPYDLVIFDEAHKLSASQTPDLTIDRTERYKLAEALAGVQSGDPRWFLNWSTQHLLLLTATPHMGKDFPYYALWRLLEPDVLATRDAFAVFPPEERARHFIRRTKEEMVRFDGAPLYPQRQSDTLGFDLTAGEISERALYDRTTDYMRTFYNRAGILNRSAARLATSVFQRRLTSSTYAVLRSFERRLERLDEVIAAVREGRLTAQQIRAAQQRLFDPFEDTPDEEAPEHGREGHEANEEDIVRLIRFTSLADLQAERREVEHLIDLARQVLATGHESKFETLREVLLRPEFKHEKLIVFTEHRDTMVWLRQRLEAMGFTDSVATIHGGMDFRDREVQVERFRKPVAEGGAQYLLATDAAGEGINLQFCWLMVNYDVPWNPARLEQRMGRIHRYGQKHDPVVIVNLIANDTREGLVIGTLLHKLDAIRRELRSDKVFDVVGRLFDNVSITEYLSQALAEDDAEGVARRLDGALTTEQVQALEARDRRLFGDGGDVKRELPRLRIAADHETLRKLLPGYVRQFVERAADALDFVIEGDLDGVFSLRPRMTGALDPLWEVIETYPAEARHRLTVYRPDPTEPALFLHPGEPVFERLRAIVTARFAEDARRGAAFIDPTVTSPYLLFVARVTLVRQVSSDSVPEAVHTEFLAARTGEDGRFERCAPEQLLLLRGADRFPVAFARMAARAPELEVVRDTWLREQVGDPLLAERRHDLQGSMPEREDFLARGFDYQAAELAAARVRLTEKAQKGNAAARAALDRVKVQQRSLERRRAEALDRLRSEPGQLRIGDVEILARALVAPSTSEADRRRYDADVEAAAMQVARAWEEAAGAVVTDVSTPPRARAAGLSDYPGFDLLAVYPNGDRRAIEVKGRAGVGDVDVSENEWARACNLRAGYWLHVVFNCGEALPRLCRVQDPFSSLLVRARGGVIVDDKSILAVAESAVRDTPVEAPLPETLRKLFWDHRFDELRWPSHADLVIGRIVQDGDEDAIRWLRDAAGDATIADWLRRRGGRGIDAHQLRLWQALLALPDKEVDPWVQAARENPWGQRSAGDGTTRTGQS